MRQVDRSVIPQPLRALRAFVRAARKAEKTSNGLTAGEVVWGYTVHNGVKTPHRMATLMDNFVDACNKYFEFE